MTRVQKKQEAKHFLALQKLWRSNGETKMDEPKTYCTDCIRYKNGDCPWDLMYKDSDYAYDCMNYEET